MKITYRAEVVFQVRHGEILKLGEMKAMQSWLQNVLDTARMSVDTGYPEKLADDIRVGRVVEDSE